MASKGVAKIPFRLGDKKIYFPQHVFTLIRSPKIRPDQAAFRVPLNVNKFDVRDYLWNIYGLRTYAVKSMIYVGKIYRAKAFNPTKGRWQALDWRRHSSQKKVIVDMDRPFVYPAAPDNLSPYNKYLHDMIAKIRRTPNAVEKGVIKNPKLREQFNEARAKHMADQKALKDEDTAAVTAE
ncbi:mitochondrial 54S ribosomal protein YmL41 [Saitoella coloradoensis]